MASEATPRVNAQHLDNFLHQTIRVVGKVSALHGETATLDAEGSITVHLDRLLDMVLFISSAENSHLQVNNAAEIIGKVQPDLSIKSFRATDFGSNFDFAAANAVVEATHKYKEIFYKKDEE